MKQYSIANARDTFASIVRAVEENGPVEFTRRGRPVAVLLSTAEYQRLTEPRTTFEEAYARFLEKVDLASLDIDPTIFDVARDRSPGREIIL